MVTTVKKGYDDMAKKANIMRFILENAMDGLTLIDDNGYFVSEDAIVKSAEDAYIESLNRRELPVNTTFDEFMKTYQGKSEHAVNALCVYNLLSKEYGWEYVYNGRGKDLTSVKNKANSLINGGNGCNGKKMD